MKIKKMLQAIANDGCGIISDDEGSGCGGPGYIDSDTINEMLNNGDFDDAVIVDFDEDMARSAHSTLCEFDEGTEWAQIEFNRHDDGYYQIAWIWTV